VIAATPHRQPTAQQAESGKNPEKKRGTHPVAWLVLLLMVAGGWYFYQAGQGKSVKGAIAGPRTIAQEVLILDEGEAKAFCFSVPSKRKIDVQVSAKPEKIDVITMNQSDWNDYKKAKGSIWGGEYHYVPELSPKSIVSKTFSGVLSEGSWCVAVARPRESLVFTDHTSVNLRIRGY
jgi:hypothetical protein